jgi:pimeloyl-ACP methyl ester carboxylesterase
VPDIELEGAILHYERNGSSGRAIVLVHGATGGAEDWQGQVRDLGDEFDVVALDLRCHGRSTGAPETCSIEPLADDVNEVVDRLGLAPAVIVGHSVGSRVVIEAVARRPESYAGLVLLDGSWVEREPRNGGEPAPTDAEIDAIWRAIGDDFAGPRTDAATMARILERATSTPMALKRALLDTGRDWDAERFSPALASLPAGLPVLAIQSTYLDETMRRRSLTPGTTRTPYMDAVAARIPTLQTAVVPDVGHFTMIEASAEVTSLIGGFARALF